VAHNFAFLKDAPYAHFTDEDRKIFEEALDGVLYKGADGESRTWSNPSSKAGGEIKALKSFERDGLTCRTLSIANQAKGRSNAGKYNFCRQANGKWPVAN